MLPLPYLDKVGLHMSITSAAPNGSGPTRRCFFLGGLVGLLTFGLLTSAARAELVISSNTTQNGGTLTIDPASYLLIDGAGSPTLTLAGGAVTSGVNATIVGGTNGGRLFISGGSVMTSTGLGYFDEVATHLIVSG